VAQASLLVLTHEPQRPEPTPGPSEGSRTPEFPSWEGSGVGSGKRFAITRSCDLSRRKGESGLRFLQSLRLRKQGRLRHQPNLLGSLSLIDHPSHGRLRQQRARRPRFSRREDAARLQFVLTIQGARHRASLVVRNGDGWLYSPR